MNAPIWVIVLDLRGRQLVLRCDSPGHADNVIYHNTYYGRRCLKIRIKEWKSPLPPLTAPTATGDHPMTDQAAIAASIRATIPTPEDAHSDERRIWCKEVAKALTEVLLAHSGDFGHTMVGLQAFCRAATLHLSTLEKPAKLS